MLRCDLADGVVVELRRFAGGEHGLVFQGAAALLVVLGQKIRLLRGRFALVLGQGDFQLRWGRGTVLAIEAHPQDKGGVQCQGQAEGKPESVVTRLAGPVAVIGNGRSHVASPVETPR